MPVDAESRFMFPTDFVPSHSDAVVSDAEFVDAVKLFEIYFNASVCSASRLNCFDCVLV